MPSAPPGTVTFTLVSARNPVAGVNVAVSPDTCQLPLTDGESFGSGVCGDSAEENFTVIGAAPFSPRAPPAGVTETTFSGATGAATFAFVFTWWVLVTGVLLLTLAIVSWPDPLEDVAAYAHPTTSTAVAAPAVAAITRC
jgi:hypothetical protein